MKFKEPRKYLNDTIKSFEEYALKQGSSKASKYYVNFTKAINKHLFSYDSSKDITMNILDKYNLDMLNIYVATKLKLLILEGTKEYKEIYKDISIDIKKFKKKDAVCIS